MMDDEWEMSGCVVLNGKFVDSWQGTAVNKPSGWPCNFQAIRQWQKQGQNICTEWPERCKTSPIYYNDNEIILGCFFS